jgi:hypothetical protein
VTVTATVTVTVTVLGDGGGESDGERMVMKRRGSESRLCNRLVGTCIQGCDIPVTDTQHPPPEPVTCPTPGKKIKDHKQRTSCKGNK